MSFNLKPNCVLTHITTILITRTNRRSAPTTHPIAIPTICPAVRPTEGIGDTVEVTNRSTTTVMPIFRYDWGLSYRGRKNS